MWQGRIHARGFMPAASPKALNAISRTIRRWTLHHHSDKSCRNWPRCNNPYIQGWITYYGNFYRTQLRPTLKRIDIYVMRWARRKFKRLRHQTKGARDWFDRLRRANPTLLAHWQLCHGNGRTSGAVRIHVRFRERLEVKALRATRQKLQLRKVRFWRKADI